MIPVHEAQKRLVMAGYTVDLQPIYRNLTILDADYSDVRDFLDREGYAGDIIVIGKTKGETSQKRTKMVEGKEERTDGIKIVSGASGKGTDCNGEETYEQLELKFS